MNLSRICVILVSVAFLAAAGGCSHEQRDWHSAQAANTIEAYEQFISTHPKSAHDADAQAQIAQLTEARDWQRASTADTADAYRQFLSDHRIDFTTIRDPERRVNAIYGTSRFP